LPRQCDMMGSGHVGKVVNLTHKGRVRTAATIGLMIVVNDTET
jgi:hypothetical protein